MYKCKSVGFSLNGKKWFPFRFHSQKFNRNALNQSLRIFFFHLWIQSSSLMTLVLIIWYIFILRAVMTSLHQQHQNSKNFISHNKKFYLWNWIADHRWGTHAQRTIKLDFDLRKIVDTSSRVKWNTDDRVQATQHLDLLNNWYHWYR